MVSFIVIVFEINVPSQRPLFAFGQAQSAEQTAVWQDLVLHCPRYFCLFVCMHNARHIIAVSFMPDIKVASLNPKIKKQILLVVLRSTKPCALSLLAVGLGGLALVRRRRS